MKCLNVHASLYVRVFTISMDHDQMKTHLLDDHKDLTAFFWSCPIYSVFHWTSLLLEAFNFLGYKIKPEKILSSLGFSYLMISKSAETLRRVNTPVKKPMRSNQFLTENKGFECWQVLKLCAMLSFNTNVWAHTDTRSSCSWAYKGRGWRWDAALQPMQLPALSWKIAACLFCHLVWCTHITKHYMH